MGGGGGQGEGRWSEVGGGGRKGVNSASSLLHSRENLTAAPVLPPVPIAKQD